MIKFMYVRTLYVLKIAKNKNRAKPSYEFPVIKLT